MTNIFCPLFIWNSKKLDKLGWNVTKKYIGKQPLQSTRYEKIADILKENGKYQWKVRMNRDNCKYIFLSMFQAEAVEKGKDYGKDKKTERDKSFPARESTHYSDAFDTLVHGRIVKDKDSDVSTGNIFTIESRLKSGRSRLLSAQAGGLSAASPHCVPGFTILSLALD